MKKMELENLNSFLKAEVKDYANSSMEEILTRIKAYENVYEVLGITEEYHRTINLSYIPYLNIDFFDMENLINIIDTLEYYKVKINSNVLLDDLDSFTSYLIELIWTLNIDIEDKRKMEKSLNEI